MSGLDRERTPRLAAPSWRDPRLAIGILLVLASVASVVALVGGANRSVPMYVARDGLVVGQNVDADSLQVVQVVLGEVSARYLAAGEQLPAHAVATRQVAKGELVARSSIGVADALDRKPAPVTVSEPLPKEVVVGASVDVWVALPNERNGYAEPVLLLPGVEVAAVTAPSGGLGGTRDTQLMVLVSDAQMPRFLGAVANAAKVSVVWNAGAAR